MARHPARIATTLGLLGLVAPLVLLGCEEKKPATAKPAASADEGPAVDPNLAKAMASAAARPAKTTDGPPETGIFAPGVADKQMPRGALKLELAKDGDEPRVTLKQAPWRGQVTTRVSIRIGRAALPSVDLTFALSTEKKKDDDKDPPRLVAEIKKAELSKEQPGGLPKDAEKEIAKLKGGIVTFAQAKDGGLIEPEAKPSKDTGPEVAMFLDAAADALFLAHVPVPTKPVGVGATWIVGSRQVLAGTEVVSYRLFKVTKVDGDKLTLSLESHQYSVGGALLFPGAPKGPPQQYQGAAGGELVLRAKDGAIEAVELQEQAVAAYGADRETAKALQIQIDAKVFHDEKKAKD